MRFALFDNRKKEPATGLKGICPGCSQPVIAKCGDKRVHHWAHARNKMCDSWWEPETEWHRNWKSNFPEEWQEVFLLDEDMGEKHIADIRTNQGIVIEFQHSQIHLLERKSREKFHKHLTWVVDGTRLLRDFPRFLKGKETFRIIKKGIFRVDYPEECFPTNWLDSTALVIFDFRGNDSMTDNIEFRKNLYCLFPVRIGASLIVTEISRRSFVETVNSGDWLKRTSDFLAELNQVEQKRQADRERQERIRSNAILNNLTRTKQFRRRRPL